MRHASLIAAAALACAPAMALAESSWDGLRAELYGDRAIEAAVVSLQAPLRATDDRAVPISVSAALPDGRTVRSVTVVIDENPMPVSAVVEMHRPMAHVAFDFTMRLNGPSPVHVVVEADDGRLYMAEQMVKTSGLGACAAPPVTDDAMALETLGRMELAAADPAAVAVSRLRAAGADGRARLTVSHPQHSGMQMDQITLLYRPARFIETLEVWAGEAPLFTLTGSISLSENPEIGFDRPAGADGSAPLRVRMTDTDGAVFERRFGLES
ncbi:quinoprotein dehydrogenase-associated SoxYZ-like carrier [Rubrimonas cliftonensis]|uniref:Sulfur-oxidizing protein SoxY n=1 Tax=Rubrimonas cliftonensis TaxID=89524 RepID=A0A1H4BWJ3_9RHOB|nr:quinoprotein dehydrogenase-associated SoxYZ-like carrier [Rubrimonas cliftonensis]SEA52460.1 sulfur-oxidizing protein SoxY [Rubrimonas cliftonensis]